MINDSPTSPVAQIVALAAGAELFRAPGDDTGGYISFLEGMRRTTAPVRSEQTRHWLQALFFDANGRVPGRQMLTAAVDILETEARRSQVTRDVAVRLAAHGGRIYLDLADDHGRVVEVDATGYRIVTDPPVRFIHPPGQQALPVPVDSGEIAALRALANVGDADWAMLTGVLVAAMRPGYSIPVTAVLGEHGSGKTTICRMIQALLDPSTTGLRAEPSDTRDLFIAAKSNWLIGLDNVSQIPNWMSDCLCRLATGGGFATRKLRTDAEEQLFQALRPVLINGIGCPITQPDLLDRAVLIQMLPVPDENRRTEAEIWGAFHEMRPRLLGAILRAVSSAMRNLPSVRLPALPRMADFITWATAAERELGFRPGTMSAAYAGNRRVAQRIAIEDSVIVHPLLDFMRHRRTWAGTARHLLAALEEVAQRNERSARAGWPARASHLLNSLRRASPTLRGEGIDVELADPRNRGALVTLRNARAVAPFVRGSESGETNHVFAKRDARRNGTRRGAMTGSVRREAPGITVSVAVRLGNCTQRKSVATVVTKVRSPRMRCA
jgi:energy-coupling factor transporter ATP-binding protein EcfA2